MHSQRGWRKGLSGLVGLALALSLAACGQKQAASSNKQGAAKEGEIVATIGETALTVEMLEKEINQQNPYVRMRYNSPERKKEFVKNLVRFEVLAAEAERRNMQQDPEVIRRVKRVMIDKLMEQLQSTLVKLEDISDQEVEAYYNEQKALYQQPPKVRVSQIVTTSEGEARRVLAALQKKPGDVKVFNELVQRHSIDEKTKAKNGDLGFLTQESKELPEPLVKAALAIEGMWQGSGPVQVEGGWAVLMKTGEVKAVNRPLELEQNRIKNRLYNEKKIKAIEKHIEDLQQQASVQINEENLAKVKVDMSAPRPANATSPEPKTESAQPAAPSEPGALPLPGGAPPTKVR